MTTQDETGLRTDAEKRLRNWVVAVWASKAYDQVVEDAWLTELDTRIAALAANPAPAGLDALHEIESQLIEDGMEQTAAALHVAIDALAANPAPAGLVDGFTRCPLCGDVERVEDIVGGVCLTCADGIAFAQNARRGAIEVPHGSSD